MPDVLAEFVEILVGGIVELGEGIASGVTAMAQKLFLTTTGTGESAVSHLSAFGGIVAIFAGIALATAITSRVYIWVTSLGN